MSTIFVQIASFNDKELSKTVNDCILKSSGANNIKFGIHECYIDEQTFFNDENISISYSKAPDDLGVGISRYMANKFYNGEDYYLQIDSHTRFKKDWDILAIENLEKNFSLGNKCILSSYPPQYYYDDNGEEVIDFYATPSIVIVKKNNKELFSSLRILEQEGIPPNQTMCSESISAGFIFGRGDISSVVQNPAIFYLGEEILRAAAFYTSGYNIVCPDQSLVFHLYGSDSDRVPVWNVYPEICKDLDSFSRNAVRLILSESRIGPRELGSERTLDEFGRYIGVDFEKGIYIS